MPSQNQKDITTHAFVLIGSLISVQINYKVLLVTKLCSLAERTVNYQHG